MFDDTVDQLDNAAAKLKKAADLAPDSAEVWGMLALAYGKQLRFVAEKERNQLVTRLHASSRRALAIERDQPDAQAALILAAPEFRNWLDHERACLKALRTHPKHTDLNIALARSLAQVGRCADALKHLEVALTEQPMVPRFHVFRTNMLWNLGRLDEAESEIERSFGLWPRHSSLWFTRFHFLMYNGRSDEAAAMHADSMNRPIGIPEWNFDLSALQARAVEGEKSTIDRALEASASAARQGTGFAQNAVIFASAVNALDVAFELLDAYYFGRGFSLEKAYFTKQQGVYWNSRHRDTHFLFSRPMTNARRHGRFRRLMGELGLDDYWKRSGTKPDVGV
jgi:Tfp pilus assembly protein PilF